jgi:hypothetical protein
VNVIIADDALEIVAVPIVGMPGTVNDVGVAETVALAILEPDALFATTVNV